MSFRDKIAEILNENYISLIGEAGERQNKGERHLKREDVKRKRKERSSDKKSTSSQLKAGSNMDQIDPKELKRQQRKQLQGEMRLTPKEAFASRLVAYLETGKSKHMSECFKLMEDYPRLGKYVREASRKALPSFAFKAYSSRERMDEEVGGKGIRCSGNHHNWTLSRSRVDEMWDRDEAYIMECSVQPEDAIIYVPAFSGLLERVIMEGLVDEPTTNVIRKAKILEEIVLPDKYDGGVIIELR